jgi:hypothetical protein
LYGELEFIVSGETPSLKREGPGDRGVRLAFSTVFNLITVSLLVFLHLLLWRRLRFIGRRRGAGQRLMSFLFFMPRTIVAALAVAAVVTLGLDLVARFIIGPLVRMWSNPRVPDPLEHTDLAFRLEPGETLELWSPGRRKTGPIWQPGSVVITSHHVWFLPLRGELRSHERGTVLGWIRVAAPRWGFGLIKGIPDHVKLMLNGRESELFAVANPDRFLVWTDRLHEQETRSHG